MDRIYSEISELFHGVKIREYLKDELNLSTRFIKRAAIDQMVRVNDRVVKLDYILREGDCISIPLKREETQDIPAEDIPLDIIYEDEAILVINKDPHMVVHPTKSHASRTLANAAMHHYKAKGETTIIRLVSRLDMDTSGLIMLAKNQFVHSKLSAMMQEDAVGKSYIAIVKGDFPEDLTLIDLPIYKDGPGAYYRTVDERGQRSLTEVRILEKAGGYSLLKLKLLTGRTHQIRVHLSHHGFPVIGDSLYGGEMDLITRQALHAYELSLAHPVTGKQMDFRAELKEDMRLVLEGIGFTSML
jgi:23S rRNA pseudouridine1911/1915/1917 synthase